jgi:hypothetical protein
VFCTIVPVKPGTPLRNDESITLPGPFWITTGARLCIESESRLRLNPSNLNVFVTCSTPLMLALRVSPIETFMPSPSMMPPRILPSDSGETVEAIVKSSSAASADVVSACVSSRLRIPALASAPDAAPEPASRSAGNICFERARRQSLRRSTFQCLVPFRKQDHIIV